MRSATCLLCIVACWASVARAQSLLVTDPICEYQVDPIGIGMTRPRLSWKIVSDRRAVMQSAYHIRCAANPEALQAGRDLLWDTGKIESDQSLHVTYGGPALQSRQRVYWQVRVWDEQDQVSSWSEAAFWELGLLEPTDWQAQWIEPNLTEDRTASNPCPMLRKEFKLAAPVRRARIYMTCHGVYELSLNGQRVGDHLFAPGWTVYDERLQVQTYDVTDLLKSGENCIGVVLGDGWYRGRLRQGNRRNLYGNMLGLLLQLEIEREDGTREVVASDTSWRASTGPILKSDFYNGETYDARLVKDGWNEAGYDDSDWATVTAKDFDKDVLVAQVGPSVRAIEEIKPAAILKTPAGETVVDMGQNMVGWLRLKVQGPAGTRVRLRHAEVLDAEGNFYTANLRSAQQTDEYILSGAGKEIWQPHFTFHGFRYVAIDGWPGELAVDDLTGVVIHSDTPRTGSFTCSDATINRLQENIWWGQRGNFVDIPSDCPQRDERLGWTGDAQVFARTACFNAQVATFYAKWLADLAVEQLPNGAVSHVVPDTYALSGRQGMAASSGWADAAVIVPWTVYLCYGDKGILAQQYESMKAWVEYMIASAGADCLYDADESFGDWLAFGAQRSGSTPKNLITQAFFAHSTDLLARAAAVLGKSNDATRYTEMLEHIKNAFRQKFIAANGKLMSNTQTAYALALAFDLLPPDQQRRAAQHLVEEVKRYGHITTGFLGTPWICHVLSEHGYTDLAYQLLEHKQYPSWLYPITKGATTIWERWDGIKPDGSFQDATMNSFNHYAYGAIGAWLYQVVAGIEIDETQPGYKHFIIQPHPGGSLTHAQARFESLYGPIMSGWRKQDGRLAVEVEVPGNTTATVRLPAVTLADVTESGKPLSETSGILESSQAGEMVVLRIGSGRYMFASPETHQD
ncbi:MAG: glycoside hydrolase family 78 protein [Sedimentisphaerales bacterium]|nr:glycoside hydrolase family 78 protein [Sedimentisphaerales bacterium]